MLAALRQARDTWPHPELNYAYSPLSDILARPEFQWQEQPRSPLAELWDRIIIWLLERVADLFEIAGMTGAVTAGLFRFVFTAVFVLITAAALAYLFQGLLANFVAEAEIDADDGGFIENLTAKTALERAQTLSSSGDYRSAVRYLYLSTLLMLEERGLLRYDRSLTNHEYLGSVAHLPELFAVLYEVIDVFDRVWYGYQPLNEAEYTHYATRVAELKRQK